MKIYAFHLLNDYSGSPKVLSQLIKGWTEHEIDVTVVICTGRKGFLSNIPGVKYVEYWYRWAANPFLRLINLVISQVIVVAKLLVVVKKNDLVYINTVLPFGAALLGKLKGCRIIYHIHETSMKPAVLKKFLFGIMRYTAHDVVYVSKYLALNEPVANKRTHILPNAIESEFLTTAQSYQRPSRVPKTILMVCSLKWYKGIDEFMALAKLNPQLEFNLVVNASQGDIDDYVKTRTLTKNITLFPVQTNLHPFYNNADVIVNLSRPDGWIETFGLTIIEGMAHSIPAIVPPLGGIAELVDDGSNGFVADSRDIDGVSKKMNRLLESSVYSSMSKEAAEKINDFKEHVFLSKSLAILNT